ncbi:MAG: AmmeMemoRadiSam system protein A [Succinivibrionaceae bacterium]|nr:AmmeMemoRadiSam system protein A [Succinivibrionaceae bacterium]
MSILGAFTFPHPPLIVPAVGRGRESQIAQTAASCGQAARQIADLGPDVIVIASPHSVMYRDYFHISPGRRASGSLASFGGGDATFEVDYDQELALRIQTLAEEIGLSAGTLGQRDASLDHGTMVPLWFIGKELENVPIVRIGLSGMSLDDHYRLGQIIARAANDLGRHAVFVASGDLSHKLKEDGPYGFDPAGVEYDRRIMDVFARGALGEILEFEPGLLEQAAECGHRSFAIMAGTLDGMAVKSRVYSHEDVTGVGYGIASFVPEEPDGSRRFLDARNSFELERLAALRNAADDYVKLAIATIEHYVKNGSQPPMPKELPRDLLDVRAGAFVSIHKRGDLRGCIGTIAPVADCLAREIMDNAVSAAARDPRFDPITPDELKWLEINVDVLSAAEDISSEAELDVKKYGVIVSAGGRRGLLLPDLEGVDTVRQQVEIARRKAGIPPGQKVKLQRFQVVRHR